MMECALAAHRHRAEQLSIKLASRLRSPSEPLLELCTEFDEAVEFAALEGEPIAEAIASFVEERWSVAECQELAFMTGYGSAGVDTGSMSLPVMPRLASRLLRTSNETTSSAELAGIAGSDPVLAAKMLGAANSALHGRHDEIFDLVAAVMRLGIPEARKVLLASCLGNLFVSKPLQDLWKHSQRVAEEACALAELADLEPELAYLCGLLHDIGRLGFMKLPQRLRLAEMEWLAAGFPAVYAETLAYGLDHAALAANLLHAWELPEGIVEAVEFHHRPEQSGSRLSAVVSLAEDLDAQTANAGSEDLWPAMRRSVACAKAGITPDQLGAFHSRRPALVRAAG